jgi:hypothetical protein
MARRTATSYRAGKAAQAAGAEDQAGSEAAPAKEDKGPSFVDVLVITTTVLLVAAILMTDYYLGKHYAAGVFF